MADQHDDDDQFKSLRAVWLEMRDEAPPQRGLDALMAAAHLQAKMLAATAKPPWWKIIVRPPVLAFATVALLVGGVVIVIRHDDKVTLDVPTHDSANMPTPPTTQHVEAPPPPPKAVTTPEHERAPVRSHMSAGAAIQTEDAPRTTTLVDQLEQQVEGAVTRGDCETAKAIAARIAKQDTGYYGEHTAAAVKSCL